MILIVSNSRDYGTDAVIRKLRGLGREYLRLDADLLREDEVVLDPVQGILSHRLPGAMARKIAQPSSILYRAPTHLRESSGHRYSPEELLRRHQWAAFCRSLVVFNDAFWINHPAATYLAESKPYQLATATACGFAVPRTLVANCLPDSFSDATTLAVKALDTFLIRKDGLDHFFYTTILRPEDCESEDCREMPMIFQASLHRKLDLRVTVVGERCFIAETSQVVEGDWRRQKEYANFGVAKDSDGLAARCQEIVRRLGLRYAAIDLARNEDGLWFLEINPTGEWAWLDPVFDGDISSSIADLLAANHAISPD